MGGLERWRAQRGASTLAMTASLVAALGAAALVYHSAAWHGVTLAHENQMKNRGLMLAEGAIQRAIAQLNRAGDWGTLELPNPDYIPQEFSEAGVLWAELYNNPVEAEVGRDGDGTLVILGYGQPAHDDGITIVEAVFWRPSLGGSLSPPAVLTIVKCVEQCAHPRM